MPRSFFLFVLGICCQLHAQNDFKPIKYWVTFTDKKYNDYSLDNPEEFLTDRALLRRINQNIPLDSTDLPVSQLYIDSLLADTAVNVIYTSRWFNAALAEIPLQESVEKIKNMSFVEDLLYVKPEIDETHRSIIFASPKTVDNFLFGGCSFLDFHSFNAVTDDCRKQVYGFTYDQVNLINGIPLHEKGYDGEGMLIALMDAGYTNVDSIDAFSHLWYNGQIAGWRDFVDPKDDIFKVHSHGTLVLSVMAASVPFQFYGVAQGANYILLRSEDAASEFLIEECNWIAAAEYADSLGADILNTSLGYTVFDDPVQNHTYEDMDGQTTLISRAANYAFEKGMLVVNSAGNYALQDWMYISAPADSRGGIAVGAVNTEGERASFSSVGPSFDNRIKPDVMAVGRNNTVINANGEIITASGTSFSSPMIAGMAACLWQAHPNRPVGEIKRAIIKSSHKIFNPDTLYGHGIPDFYKAYNLLKDDLKTEPFVKIFPNPFYDNFRLSLYFERQSRVKIQLINTKGQILMSNIYHVTEGYNTFYPFMNLNVINSGIYLLRIKSDKYIHTTRIVKAG